MRERERARMHEARHERLPPATYLLRDRSVRARSDVAVGRGLGCGGDGEGERERRREGGGVDGWRMAVSAIEATAVATAVGRRWVAVMAAVTSEMEA